MYDSLTFSTNRLGRPILRGESGLYCCTVSLLAIFEFDDGYAFYCVMLLYKRSGQCIFFQQLSKIYKYVTIGIFYWKALKTSLKDDIISYYTMTGVRYAQENIIWC